MGRCIRDRGRAALVVVVLAAALVVPRTVAALSAHDRARHQAAFDAVSCGVERWPVKTLADRSGRRLNLSRVQPATVEALLRLRVHQGGQSSRGGKAERTVYRVTGRLIAAKVEDDSDIHFVIQDPRTGRMMIAELPALGCTVGSARHARVLMQQARVAFLSACYDPGASDFTEYDPRSRAAITGVGFFDFFHGQRGVAPNDVELHPVIGFAGRCRAS